jgi:hypothetical protein
MDHNGTEPTLLAALEDGLVVQANPGCLSMTRPACRKNGIGPKTDWSARRSTFASAFASPSVSGQRTVSRLANAPTSWNTILRI